ncbi:hypothetical protein GCM10010168_91840 [Actinoplanes ianthinogenes]|uniref:Uncharacterized protein n=1 Tax=Actinoplanes ianthinogenes TaxID=122358 RepID=A0ABM7LNJ0_9ACTN|nr:hypothetical protein Aiant_14490 [Actinoplanes ianthinogenes]GGR58540.1 hypothetical protein GCM10010168_91840 [Actinoplanes ianthinogenes]
MAFSAQLTAASDANALGSGDPAETTLKSSVNGCLPYVWAIWISVLLAGLLGVAKPMANL